MKHRQPRMKWKLAAYLAGFVLLMLVVLYLFQIVFLERFYEQLRIGTVKNYAQSITRNLDDEKLDELLSQAVQDERISVMIYDAAGNELRSSEDHYSFRPDILREELAYLYRQAEQNQGELMLYMRADEIRVPESWVGDQGLPPMPRSAFPRRADNESPVSIVYLKLAQMEGQPVLLLLYTIITPISTTVDTIRVQLAFILIFFLLLSALLAWLLSKKITKPIVLLNHSAKRLGEGRYDVPFEGGGYREITELRDTLNYAAKELSTVESLRRELIANISHDLRTPLTMICGYGEVMRDIPGENTPENVQIIIDESKRLSELVDDILDLSKLQSGAHELCMTEVALTELTRGILKRYQKLTEQEGYRITFSSDREVSVSGDELKLTQVIYNLINNAINYTGADKRVTVTQTVRGGAVRLSVTDTGEGIAQEQLPYIWDRYYKVDREHRRAQVGTGLGLSIVRAILEQHQARYGVESELGRGSTFWFELAVKQSHPDQLKEETI